MNIYKNFIEDTQIKRPVLNTKEVLLSYISDLEGIKGKVKQHFYQVKEIKEKLRIGGYSLAYRDETEQRLKEDVNKNISSLSSKYIEGMESRKEELKRKSTMAISPGDRDAATNNLLKLTSILGKLESDDIKEIFNSSKEKDIAIIETLYMQVKNTDSVLANEISEYLYKFTKEDEIRIVEGVLEEIKSLNQYLDYEYITRLNEAYIGITPSYDTKINLGGTVDKIIDAYIDSIKGLINKLED